MSRDSAMDSTPTANVSEAVSMDPIEPFQIPSSSSRYFSNASPAGDGPSHFIYRLPRSNRQLFPGREEAQDPLRSIAPSRHAHRYPNLLMNSETFQSSAGRIGRSSENSIVLSLLDLRASNFGHDTRLLPPSPPSRDVRGLGELVLRPSADNARREWPSSSSLAPIACIQRSAWFSDTTA